MANRHAVVYGARDQIGAAVDHAFAREGATVVSPLTERPPLEFVRPISRLVTAHFLIATWVARHVIDRGTGVILTMTGSGLPTAGVGDAMTAWAGVDALCGQPARELGPHGIRVLWLRSNGVSVEADNPAERERSMLNRLASPDDVGNVAAFLASGDAAAMTALAANITSGAAVGLGLFARLDGASGMAVLVTGSVIFSVALAPVETLATDLVVGAAPPERAGAALAETSAALGGALGVALLVSSARPSAAARRLTPCRPGSRLKPRHPPESPSAAPWRGRASPRATRQ